MSFGLPTPPSTPPLPASPTPSGTISISQTFLAGDDETLTHLLGSTANARHSGTTIRSHLLSRAWLRTSKYKFRNTVYALVCKVQDELKKRHWHLDHEPEPLPKAEYTSTRDETEAENRVAQCTSFLDIPCVTKEHGRDALTEMKNKRLAVIGDLVLYLVLAEQWFRSTSESPDFWHNEIRAKITNGIFQAKRAIANDIQKYVMKDVHSHPRRGQPKPEDLPYQHMADTVEALLGAVYLDAGGDWKAQCLKVMTKLGLNIDGPGTSEEAKRALDMDVLDGYGRGVKSPKSD